MGRTTYNPQFQFAFAQLQAQCARILPDTDGVICRVLAERAWHYGRKLGHDGGSFFGAQELLAALELPVADAASDLFGFTSNGVFRHPPLADRQTSRNAGGGLGFRSFMGPLVNKPVCMAPAAWLWPRQAASLTTATGNGLPRDKSNGRLDITHTTARFTPASATASPSPCSANA